MSITIRNAASVDAPSIHAVIAANASDPSLFQQSLERIERDIGTFVVAMDGADRVVGCAALHVAHATAEVLGVAVHPNAQSKGAGAALVSACVARALSTGATLVWLGTKKPEYFARHGFAPMSRWRLPIRVLLRKLTLVFEQPLARWIPAIFGGHVFMCLPTRSDSYS